MPIEMTLLVGYGLGIFACGWAWWMDGGQLRLRRVFWASMPIILVTIYTSLWR